MNFVKLGSFVLLKNPGEGDKVMVGKVTQVKETVFHYSWYARPEELPGVERKGYHSRFELIRTDETRKEFISNVIKPVHVLRLQEFKSKFPNPVNDLPSTGNLSDYESDYYLFRQKYSTQTQAGGSG